MTPSLTYDRKDPSWKLLLSYLSPHQRKTLRKHGFFYVRTKGDRIYALPSHGYVFVAINKETGEPGTIYGAFVAQDLKPLGDADNLLALFLALTTKPGWLIDLACKNVCAYDNKALDRGTGFNKFLEESRA